MICPDCGTENRSDGKFCFQCGAALAGRCTMCGSTLRPGARFCDECGTPVGGPQPRLAEPGPAPSSERRLVSILFADLVGFTTLSESRDAEEVRELLSRYFDTSRTLITRYGGTVEKFIGDAVMAVWGTPVAQEDDAERAVRAAMELVDAVGALGQEVGAPELAARAGVLTGEAAVTLGAEGQGMVAGDLVNTASRIQSAASPGRVLVGDATRRSSEAAIAYEDAGERELKGKAEPVRLWRALRVVAAVGGVQRSAGLEPPFVGRDRELRLLKDLFHASAEEGKAHLVSVVGAAGVGKSRLLWEFEKYVDGLAGQFRWHRGRCLAYGEGVTYWALAEMVRTRADIVEGEEASSALAKLRGALEENLPDPEERRWVEPRLAHLLGLEERVSREREDLFAAWRLFYERLSDEMPTVMVFEDMQWAEATLLDFIEYLLEWARDHRLFVITVARPDLADRRPNWGVGRSATSLYLDPLADHSMKELLTGLLPGVPEELDRRILGRAEGIPLYAVETVRMLLDRGLLVQEGNSYRPTGPIEALEVPETLHALIAARLDGLTPEERRLLQDGSVLGKSFTKGGLAAVSGLPDAELEPIVGALTRKEVLTVQADPRSPERGQYAFVQDLLRRVAYETLSKKERRTRHLAVADFLESTWGSDDEEVAEVVASHVLAAYRLAPDAPDAPEIRARARHVLARAGERAASLAADEEAQRYFDQAAELDGDPVDRAALLERSGTMARTGGRTEEAAARFEEAVLLFEEAGLVHPAARVSARMGEVLWDQGKLGEAVDRLERSFGVVSTETPDEDFARLAAELGRILFFTGQQEAAAERIEVALELAESLWLPEVLSQALNTKAVIMMAGGRRRESLALMKYALDVALEHDLPMASLRAYYNLADLSDHVDRYHEAKELVASGLALARRLGIRQWEWVLLAQVYPLVVLGEWDEALARLAQLPTDRMHELRSAYPIGSALLIPINRGDLETARRVLESLPEAASSSDVQERLMFSVGHAALLRWEGRFEEALEQAERAFGAWRDLALSHESVREGFVEAVESAFALGDLGKVAELLDTLSGFPRGTVPQFLHAHSMRFRSRLAAARGGNAAVEDGFKGASGLFRELGVPFWLAVTLLEHAEWLASQGRSEEGGPMLDEARGTFERLQARPWLERVDRVGAAGRVAARS